MTQSTWRSNQEKPIIKSSILPTSRGLTVTWLILDEDNCCQITVHHTEERVSALFSNSNKVENNKQQHMFKVNLRKSFLLDVNFDSFSSQKVWLVGATTTITLIWNYTKCLRPPSEKTGFSGNFSSINNIFCTPGTKKVRNVFVCCICFFSITISEIND